VRLTPGSILFPEGEPRGLTLATASAVADGPGWWLTFVEIRNRSAAEGLRDRYLEVEVERGADLEPGQAYWHEILGSEVRGAGGRLLGQVVDIYRAGETEVYVVRGEVVGEFDVPAVRAIVTEFAPERGQIVVDEAVLDLGPATTAPRPTRAQPRKPHRWSRHGKGAGESAPGNETPG
jgi:16S rRNA processing protein RimM